MILSSLFVHTSILFSAITIAALSSFLITGTQGVQIRDEVTMKGYIMDTFCIDRGTLLDAPSIQTLVNPELHSIHCLIDVLRCRNSGYEILADPTVEGGKYTRAYKLDTRGNQMVFERAAMVGARCTECTGEGTQEKGYRALVSGTVTALALDDGTPPTIDVDSLVTIMPPVQVGDEVSVEGYIMDRFCIDRGTFLDAPDVVTLEYPNLHSIHCLIDVDVCRESGYEILLDPISEGDDYRRGYRLNDDGNALVLENAKKVGVCTDCTGEGTLERGYRATVTGTVTALALDDGTPPTLDVTSLVTKVIQVGDEVEVEGYIMDRFCIDRGTLLDAPDIVTLKNPDLHSIHCLIDVEVCRESGYEVLLDPVPGSETYRRAFRLDDTGNALVLENAKKLGVCTECMGEGTLEKGFRSKVMGVVTALALDDGTPPTLDVTTIVPVLADDDDTDETSEDEEDLGDNTIRLDDSLILKYDVNDEDETVTITMTYDGIGWIAFGVGTMMIGSHAVIGLPDTALSQSNPGKYFLGDMAVSGVTLLPDANQTLTDASIEQENGVTVLTFTKPLVEPGMTPIKASGENNFLYAYGSDNTLGFHKSRNTFTLDFTAAGDVSIIETSDYKKQWTAHGITAFIAWGVLTPLAIAASILRDFIPKAGMWFQIHRAFNTMTFGFTVVAFALAVDAYSNAGASHFNGNHQIVGLVMFILVTVQVIGGVFRPHLPPKPVERNVEEGPRYEGDDETVEKKSSARVTWEYSHRIMGTVLLGMAFWQMQAGLDLYSLRFGGDELITLPAYWGWIIGYMVYCCRIYFGSVHTNERQIKR